MIGSYCTAGLVDVDFITLPMGSLCVDGESELDIHFVSLWMGSPFVDGEGMFRC